MKQQELKAFQKGYAQGLILSVLVSIPILAFIYFFYI